MSNPPLLDIAGLHIAYPGDPDAVHAVRGVDLTVGRGEVVGIVGGSGSGKSSICGAIAGLLTPAAAIRAERFELDGHDLRRLDERQWQGLRGSVVATIPQQPMTAFVPVVPVGRQLSWYLGVDPIDRYRDELLDLGLDSVVERPDALPSQFSGGQLQRLVIATVTLAAQPALLLADEPTSTLDTVTSAAVLDVLDRQREAIGSSMLLVSHDLATVADRCDRVGVMADGCLVELRPVDDLFSDPRHAHTRALIAAMAPPPLARRPASGPGVVNACRPDLTSAGPTADQTPTSAPQDDDSSATTGVPVLAVDRLYRYHGSSRRKGARPSQRRQPRQPQVVRAVDEVTFSIPSGSITALVGQSGSGKTTTARVIVGSLAPTAGTIRLDGRELGPDRSASDRRAIQLVGQNHRSALNSRRTIGHALAQAQRVHGLGRDRPDRDRASAALLERLHLGAWVLGRRPAALSGGELARVVVARSLLLSPRLLILDEPTASLDATIKASVLALLADVRDDFEVSMLVITHELSTARRLSDQVAVMCEGRIVETGPTEQVMAAPHHQHTKALLAAEPTRLNAAGRPQEGPAGADVNI